MLSAIYRDDPQIATTLAGLTLLCLLTAYIAPNEQAEQRKPSKKAATALAYFHKKKLPPGFVAFQRSYLITMGVVQLADWLQGPYVYA